MTDRPAADALEAALKRSLARVVEAMPEASPLVADGRPHCPWCRSPLVVRFTTVARAGHDPETGEAEGDHTPYINGVGMKCAGPTGCGFRPEFDVPLVEGRGAWPELDARAEYERELAERGGPEFSRLDAAYGSKDAPLPDTLDRLRALGYHE